MGVLKKFLVFISIVTLILTFSAAGVLGSVTGAKTVAYVPLDNRPVNTDRVQYLAGSIGYNIVMPSEDLYATKLDGQPLNSNKTQYGDSQAICQWLLSMEEAGCDNYVISLDQVFSGGLVNSRAAAFANMPDIYSDVWADPDDDIGGSESQIDTVISWEEITAAAPESLYINDVLKVLAADEDNNIVFFDTVMRLASTTGYNGYGQREYDALREYGKVGRKELEAEELTLDNIIKGYFYNEEGELCEESLANDFSGAKEKLLKADDRSLIKNYLNSRVRKLCLIDKMLSDIPGGDNVYYLVGIDDSSPNTSIQSNEIKYIEEKLGDNGLIFDGADELAMMSLSYLHESERIQPVQVYVKYFGGQSDAENDLETEELDKVIDKHIQGIGAVKASSLGTADISVLVLTPPRQTDLRYFYAGELVEAYLDNVENHVPTIIIDESGGSYYGALGQRLVSETDLGYLLGYSNWNTRGNAAGIALSQGISRYSYLTSGEEKSTESHEDFVRSLTFALVKDICYVNQVKSEMGTYISSLGLDTHNFYDDDVDITRINAYLGTKMKDCAQDILANLNASNMIVDLDNYKIKGIKNIELSDFSFPWYRVFECRFAIDLEGLGDAYEDIAEPEEVIIYHEAYVNGYDDGTFKPNNSVSRGEVAKMMVTALDLATSAYEGLFPDADRDSWYTPYVEVMANKGYMTGYEDKTFRPGNHMTRAEFAAFLVKYSRAQGNKSEGKTEDFNDVPADKWYYEYIKEASSLGLVSGYTDGSFRPENEVTRCEAVTMINRLLGRDLESEGVSEALIESKNPFKDIKVGYWGYFAVLEAAVDHSYIVEP